LPHKRKTQKFILREVYFGRSGDRIPVGARFSARPDRPWGPPGLLYNGYRVFPGGKPGTRCAADHSPPSSAEVLEEYSYTSSPPTGHNQACNGVTLPLEIYLSISYSFITLTAFSMLLNLMGENKRSAETCCLHLRD
jgi:hypothetical protein